MQNCPWQAKGENVVYQLAKSLNTMIVTHFASSSILSLMLFTKRNSCCTLCIRILGWKDCA